jgi:hypothetical protein
MTQAEMDKLIAEAVEAAVKPILARIEAAQARLEAAQSKLADLRAASSDRKALPPHVLAALEGSVGETTTKLALKRLN